MTQMPSRRSFMKIGTGGAIASVLGFDLQTAYAQSRELKIARGRSIECAFAVSGAAAGPGTRQRT